MRISRWGNSLAVRLPASVVKALALKAGDEIDMQVTGFRAISVSKSTETEQCLARLRAFRAKLPPDVTFERDEANKHDHGRQR